MKRFTIFALISAGLLTSCTLEENDPDAIAGKYCSKLKQCDLYSQYEYKDDASCIDSYNAVKLKYQECKIEFDAYKSEESTGGCKLITALEDDVDFTNGEISGLTPEISQKREAYLNCYHKNNYCENTVCIDEKTLGLCENNKRTEEKCRSGHCRDGECIELCQSDSDCKTEGEICKDEKCTRPCPQGSHWNTETQTCVLTCTNPQCITKADGLYAQSCVHNELTELKCKSDESCQITNDTAECIQVDGNCQNDQMICSHEGNIMQCQNNSWALKEECTSGFGCITTIDKIYCAECGSQSEKCGDNHIQYHCDAGHWKSSESCCDNYKYLDGKCENSQCPELDHTCSDQMHYRVCDESGSLTEHSCPADTICANGDCISEQCNEGDMQCSGNDIMKCSSNKWTTEKCPEGQRCLHDEAANKTQCVPQTCRLDNKEYQIDETLCDNQNNIITCQKDNKWNSSPCPAGTECQHDDAAHKTQCAPKGCSLDNKDYQDGETTCDASKANILDCKSGQWKQTPCKTIDGESCITDAGKAFCQPKCENKCSDSILYACDDSGLQNKTYCKYGCKNDHCLNCIPGTTKCRILENALQTCSKDGVWESFQCPSQCTSWGGKSFCGKNCSIGETKCSFGTLQVCQNDAYGDIPRPQGYYCDDTEDTAKYLPIPSSCGNNVIDSGEKCDGSNLFKTCRDVLPNVCDETVISGNPSCNTGCKINTNSCVIQDTISKCEIASVSSDKKDIKISTKLHVSGAYYPQLDLYCVPKEESLSQAISKYKPLNHNGNSKLIPTPFCETARSFEFNATYNLNQNGYDGITNMSCFLLMRELSDVRGELFCKSNSIIEYDDVSSVSDVSILDLP